MYLRKSFSKQAFFFFSLLQRSPSLFLFLRWWCSINGSGGGNDGAADVREVLRQFDHFIGNAG